MGAGTLPGDSGNPVDKGTATAKGAWTKVSDAANDRRAADVLAGEELARLDRSDKPPGGGEGGPS